MTARSPALDEPQHRADATQLWQQHIDHVGRARHVTQ
jgi:hypothetical protein